MDFSGKVFVRGVQRMTSVSLSDNLVALYKLMVRLREALYEKLRCLLMITSENA